MEHPADVIDFSNQKVVTNAAGKAAGIEPPKAENTIRTNFIR